MSNLRDAFSYQPLPEVPFEIRLINLYPGGFDDTIYCTIYHVNVDERRPRTQYTALSYVWGDPTQETKTIQFCYHQPSTTENACTWPSAPFAGADCYRSFQVTTKLERALRHLRDRTSERILWVDAICINQSDVKEKLSQIELMSEVYNNAVEVRIWLGYLNEVQEVIETSQLRPVSIPRRSCSRSFTEEDIGAVLRCKKKEDRDSIARSERLRYE